MINKSIILGRIGQEPRTTERNGEITMATFSLATTRNYKDKEGNWKEETQWHNITTFGYAAKKASGFAKGDMVYIEGELSYSEKDGTRYTNIIARDVKRVVQSQAKVAAPCAAHAQEDIDDSFPF